MKNFMKKMSLGVVACVVSILVCNTAAATAFDPESIRLNGCKLLKIMFTNNTADTLKLQRINISSGRKAGDTKIYNEQGNVVENVPFLSGGEMIGPHQDIYGYYAASPQQIDSPAADFYIAKQINKANKNMDERVVPIFGVRVQNFCTSREGGVNAQIINSNDPIIAHYKITYEKIDGEWSWPNQHPSVVHVTINSANPE